MITKENSFHSIYIDACWMHRAGVEDATNRLLQSYPTYSPANIAGANAIGATLNVMLWEFSRKCWKKEIDEKTFLEAILETCPELTEKMAKHLFDNAMFEAM